MIKTIWYQFVKGYVKVGLFFLMKKITVYGKENIPKKGAVIFIANHQNALIDAILIPTTNNRNTHFLTRAAVFKNDKIAKIFDSLNMLPIYRVRDGLNTIEKNLAIFEKCFNILNKKKGLEIFAEGEHHIERRIIPLKKGFGRIILGTLQKHPDLEIQIVPVGLNFDSHLVYPCSATIYYGKPIRANDYLNVKNHDSKFSDLISVVSKAMKQLTLHVDDFKNYDAIIEKLENNNVDYLNPTAANELLKNIDALPEKDSRKKQPTNWFYPLQLLFKINSFIPLFIWHKLKGGIKDVLFTNTFRFALITTLFPLIYLLQAIIVYFIFDLKYALYYLAACVFLGVVSTKTTPIPQ
ncbi:lysophospholipid acyltransferase family protein [Lutibacter holmesii]|uniref:Lysophospholipid acyltransferase family protein n=1 Tax=Lutibacter holmesii TaxID=1137985 RepID=A0ABW3WQV0_9FLAO